jgi:DNA-binding IclR family transcriptional regulator
MRKAERYQFILDVIDAYTSEHQTPPRVKDVGELTGVPGGSISTYLGLMEARGLVRRVHEGTATYVIRVQKDAGAAD